MTQSIEDFGLPDFAHVPGVNNRHEDGFLDHVKELAADETRDSNAVTNVAWHYGIRLINYQFYWEAHEVLETVWLNAPPNSRERSLVQGVIHLANGALKDRMERAGAATRLRSLATIQFDEAYRGQEHGILMQLSKSNLLQALSQPEPILVAVP